MAKAKSLAKAGNRAARGVDRVRKKATPAVLARPASLVAVLKLPNNIDHLLSLIDARLKAEHVVEAVETGAAPSTEPLTVAGRPQRARRAPHHHADTLYGDTYLMTDPVVEADDEDEGLAESLQTPDRIHKRTCAQPQKLQSQNAQSVAFFDAPAPPPSDTVDHSSHPRPQLSTNAHVLDVASSVYNVLNHLRSTASTHISLPPLMMNGVVRPYTAEALIHLYIICYESQLPDYCDLVSDTWIRAFHALRANASPDRQLWRPNPALERRTVDAKTLRNIGAGKLYQWDNGPDYGLPLPNDPLIAEDVARSIHAPLLNALYEHTQPGCGARLLWADHLVLGGNIVEHALERLKKSSDKPLHEDLLFEMTCSALRMCRRKVTLKCEESVEGAWCKRYHEHTKLGQKCYREKAGQEKKDREAREEEHLISEVRAGLIGDYDMDIDAQYELKYDQD